MECSRFENFHLLEVIFFNARHLEVMFCNMRCFGNRNVLGFEVLENVMLSELMLQRLFPKDSVSRMVDIFGGLLL